MRSSLPRIVIWDREPEAAREFAAAVKPVCGDLRVVRSHEDLLACVSPERSVDILIADLACLLSLGDAGVARIRSAAGSVPLLTVTDLRPEDYITDVRRLSIHTVIVKSPPFDTHDLSIIFDSAVDPARGFGLVIHFDHTLEMYSLTANTRETKNEAIERVINHFATNGFEIHDLYDVRLILEELVNNAFYHAFRNEEGGEKYTLGNFVSLAPHEMVRIDFGNAGDVVGFSVTDNAGTLKPDVILDKMERQYKKHGLFDESGRGLYISRMLATTLFVNIQEGQRTQIIAVFRERDRKQRLKPLVINYAKAGTFPRDPARTERLATSAAAPPSSAPTSASAPPSSSAPTVEPVSVQDIHEDFD